MAPISDMMGTEVHDTKKFSFSRYEFKWIFPALPDSDIKIWQFFVISEAQAPG